MQRNFGIGSPLNNGRKTKGKLKKTLIGPIKPMVDEDGDGIPVGIDLKDTPGGKQSNSKPDKRKPGGGNKTSDGLARGAGKALKI